MISLFSLIVTYLSGVKMPGQVVTFRVDSKLLKLIDKLSHESRTDVIVKALTEYLHKVSVVKCPRCKGTGLVTKKVRRKGRFI
jgi:transposase-like protein